MIFISPLHSLSQDEKQVSVTQEQIENIYNSCAKVFQSNFMRKDCIIEKCGKLFGDSKCSELVNEYGKKDDEKTEDGKVAPNIGKWTISRSNSLMDDSKTVVISLDAENNISAYPNKSVIPELIIICKENKTQLYIDVKVSPNPEYGLYNKSTVRIRLDDNKFLKQRWSESTNGEALFAPKAISLARKLNKSRTMLFEFTPYNSNSQLAEFDVRGLEPYLKELSKTCNWNL